MLANEKSREWYSPPIGAQLVHSDYSGSCKRSYAAPLLERRKNFPRRVDVYSHASPKLGGAFGIPDALAVGADTYFERQWFPCGRCPACINFRKSKYEKAAIGFFRSTACTVLATLTFDDRWFAQRVIEDHEKSVSLLPSKADLLSPEQLAAFEAALRSEELPRRYDAKVDRHFRDARAWLNEERSAMLKRLRVSLSRHDTWQGARFVARLEVMELGSRNKRLHLHLLWHFDAVGAGFVRQLRKWLKADWHKKRGVGFVDLHEVKDDETAIYQLKYLGKFEGDADRKIYVGSGNPVPQSNGYLAKGYERFLASRLGDETGGLDEVQSEGRAGQS